MCLTKARAQQVVNDGSEPPMLRVETVFLYRPCDTRAVGSSSSVGAPNVRWRLDGRAREVDMVVGKMEHRLSYVRVMILKNPTR